MIFLEPEHLRAVPRQKPSSGITGEDCSQPPDGVAEIMLPAWSMMSKCTVSPRTSPKRPTVGSPAPAGADRRAMAFGGGVSTPCRSLRPSRAEIERGLVGDQLAALVVVGVRQQRLDRHVDEFRIAVEFLAIGKGELGAFDLQMDEFGPAGSSPSRSNP
jgi:hypothetical protein